MYFRILGALEAIDEDEVIQLGGSQRQTLLALLLADVGQAVTTERLIAELWPDTPPEGARKTVQAHMSHLRRVLNGRAEILVAANRGYRIAIDRTSVDAARFEDILASAREMNGTDPGRSLTLYGEALALVRGPPYAGLADEVDSLAIEASRLEELRLTAIEEQFGARLATGDDAVLIAELERLAGVNPLRERLWALLMTSQYRAGRQSDALRSFARARRVLAEELGIEPSRELRSLEERILAHDVALLSGPVTFGLSATRSLRNPYKGLRRFEESDASDFFGREDLVRRLLESIDSTPGRRLLILAGPSGSGKSSVVRAGLVPALRRAGHVVAVAYPGRDPWASVASAVSVATGVDWTAANELVERVEPSDGPPLVVVLDQSEELFTLALDTERIKRFLDRLSAGEGPILWILTIRADALDQMMSHPGLGPLLADSVVLVPPLQDFEVAAAIARPAQQVGVTIDPELVAKLISEVRSRPTALPLLQFSLTDSFDRHNAGRLGLSDFESAGGWSGALARRADNIYDQLGPDEREAVRQLFLQLVTLTDEGSAVGRRLGRDQLVSVPDDDSMDRALDQFARQRLLTLDQDAVTRNASVELAHEALIVEWPRLSRWVESARDDLRLRKRLTAAVEDWQTADRDESFALRGNHLLELENWVTGSRVVIDGGAEDLLSESRRLEDSERAKRRRRRRLVMGGLSMAFVLAALSAAVALTQRQRAEDAALIASVRELAAASEANLGLDPELSLLLALEAVDQAGAQEVPEALSALHGALIEDRLLETIEFNGQGIARFSPDGESFLTSGVDPAVPVVYDFATMSPRFDLVGHSDSVIDGVFSSDGKLLATASVDGTMIVWDSGTGESMKVFETGEAMSMPGFSPDGTMLAGTSFNPDAVWVWDVESEELLWELATTEETSATYNPVFSPDGTMLAVGAATHFEANGQVAPTGANATGALVWHLESENITVVGEEPTSVRDVQFTPDGTQLLTSGLDGTVRVWEVGTWENSFTFYGHDTGVVDIDISDDGSQVASTSINTALVWELETGEVLFTLVGQSGVVDGVDLSPDATRLLTAAGDDGTLMVWDVTPSGSHELFGFPTPDSFSEVAFSPDGRTMAVSRDAFGGIDLWSFPEGELRGTLEVPTTNAISLDFSSDGGTLSIGGDGGLWLADLTTGQMRHLDDRPDAVAAFGPGNMLAYGNAEAIVITRDHQSAASEEFPIGYTDIVDVHPEGRYVAASVFGLGLGLIEVESGDPVSVSEDGAKAITFSDDGTWFATAGWYGAQTWDTDTLRMTSSLIGHSGELYDIDTHPNRAEVATASDDGTVKIWDVESGVARLTLSTGHYSKLSYSPDGRYLAVAGSGQGTVFILDTAELVKESQSRLTRWWTEAECIQYLHQPICPPIPESIAQISN